MADGVRPGSGAPEGGAGGDEAARVAVTSASPPVGASAGADAAEERRRLWLDENAEAIAAWNAWTEEHGLPLEEYRSFRRRGAPPLAVAGRGQGAHLSRGRGAGEEVG